MRQIFDLPRMTEVDHRNIAGACGNAISDREDDFPSIGGETRLHRIHSRRQLPPPPTVTTDNEKVACRFAFGTEDSGVDNLPSIRRERRTIERVFAVPDARDYIDPLALCVQEEQLASETTLVPADEVSCIWRGRELETGEKSMLARSVPAHDVYAIAVVIRITVTRKQDSTITEEGWKARAQLVRGNPVDESGLVQAVRPAGAADRPGRGLGRATDRTIRKPAEIEAQQSSRGTARDRRRSHEPVTRNPPPGLARAGPCWPGAAYIRRTKRRDRRREP